MSSVILFYILILPTFSPFLVLVDVVVKRVQLCCTMRCSLRYEYLLVGNRYLITSCSDWQLRDTTIRHFSCQDYTQYNSLECMFFFFFFFFLPGYILQGWPDS